MTEFLNLPVVQAPQPTDQLLLVREQVPYRARVEQLNQGNGGGGGTAPSNQPPNPATATAWSQPDPDGGPLIEWVWHPTVERWVSRSPVKLGYFDRGGFENWYRESHEIMTPELLFDSLVVGGYSRGDFDPDARRDIEVHLVNNNNRGSLFITKQLTGLQDDIGFRVREAINLIKPLEDCLYVILNEEPANKPPKVERAFVYLFLRAVYDPNY
ncbi:MAG: hypothetical protein AAFR99_05760 [Cyanobacteria bacterium J06629_9]